MLFFGKLFFYFLFVVFFVCIVGVWGLVIVNVFLLVFSLFFVVGVLCECFGDWVFSVVVVFVFGLV